MISKLPSIAEHSAHESDVAYICRLTGVVERDGRCPHHGGDSCLICSGCFAATAVEEKLHVQHQPIHTMFGLSYASYLVLPRSVLQSMPDAWQTRFVRTLEELQKTYRLTGSYDVRLRDENGRFAVDPLQDYNRGRRHVIPGEEGDIEWRTTRDLRLRKKFNMSTPSERG